VIVDWKDHYLDIGQSCLCCALSIISLFYLCAGALVLD